MRIISNRLDMDHSELYFASPFQQEKYKFITTTELFHKCSVKDNFARKTANECSALCQLAQK